MNEMVRQRVRPTELARRLNTSPQAVNRLVNLRYSSKIDGIDEALKALGKTLEVRGGSRTDRCKTTLQPWFLSRFRRELSRTIGLRAGA
jgi:hypothetical protein